MEEIRVTFEAVEHVHQHRATSATPKYTNFSFMWGGKYHPYISVPGWPEVKAGTTVVAVLRERDNWKTLVGWVNTETGEVAAPNYKDLLLGAAIFYPIFLAGSVALFGVSLQPYPYSVIQIGALFIFVVAGVFEFRRISKRRADRLVMEDVATKLRLSQDEL